MNKYYIARNYRSKFDAAGKAKMDCETILKQNGWQNIGFNQTWISNAVLGTIISVVGITWALLRLKRKSILCLQYPLNKFYKYILWGARFKECKIITIVHDVYALKGRKLTTEQEIKMLSKSGVLILHNSSMRKWFEENSCSSKLVDLNIFDYLHTPTCEQKRTPVNYRDYRIVFAGGMGGKKSFIYKLDDFKRGNFRLDLYGVGFDDNCIKDKDNTILDYKGRFLSNEVIDYIDGDFGLVWYGDELDTCEGFTGQYLRYNNPHKLSLYVQCEMPIIIWDKAAMADFVIKNKIGITVSSLSELTYKMSLMTQNKFNEMKRNAIVVKKNLSEGYYLTVAIDESLLKLRYNIGT
ncbi:hypothetical protein [Labilibaculum euxinus]